MALDFPSNPTDGQVFGSYVWSASKGVWQSREESAAPAVVSSVPPATAVNGDIWIDSSDGIAYFYYSDGNTSQWVEIMSSGVPSLNTKANLSGGNTFNGTQIFNTPIAVSSGGTGASSLISNGYLKGAGTSSITSQLGIPATDITSGLLDIARGGTGVLTGAGLIPIIPTSVSVNSGSASVASDGTINFSGGVTNLRVNGCFSSAYRYYRVMFEVEATSSGMDLMFQLINLGSGYTYGRIGTYSGPTFTQTFVGGSSAAMMSRSNQGNGSGGWLDVINPSHAGTKRFLSQSVDSGFMLWLGSINGSLSTFSDFQIYSLQGGTLTNGSLKVYGYR